MTVEDRAKELASEHGAENATLATSAAVNKLFNMVYTLLAEVEALKAGGGAAADPQQAKVNVVKTPPPVGAQSSKDFPTT